VTDAIGVFDRVDRTAKDVYRMLSERASWRPDHTGQANGPAAGPPIGPPIGVAA
jgi:hypothetical protein